MVFINVIGGMIIGIAQQGLSFADAAHSYTILTVGDGLVTQVPALIVSTAAGLLVAKAGVSGAADKALLAQLSGYPKALGMSGAVMIVMALLPGIPMLPFLALGGGAAALAYVFDKRVRVADAAATKKAEAATKAESTEEPIGTALRIDDLKVELGYALLPLVNGARRQRPATEQIKALRRSLAVEMGFVMPAVRILDNVQLDANAYVIKIKEVDAGSGKIWPGQYMVMDPAGGQVNIPGTHTTEPTFGLPATWIDGALKEEASIKGYTVVDAATVMSTHLTELLKNNMAELALLRRSAEAAEGIAQGAGRHHQGSGAGVDHHLGHPARAPDPPCRARLHSRPVHHPRRHRRRHFGTRNPMLLAEHVRARLARQICAQHTSAGGYLPLIALSAKWEQAFAESMVGEGDARTLAMQPSRLTEFITLVREKFEEAAREGEAPVLVTSAAVRPFVRGIVERFRAHTPVLSQSEIHPRARLKTVGSI